MNSNTSSENTAPAPDPQEIQRHLNLLFTLLRNHAGINDAYLEVRSFNILTRQGTREKFSGAYNNAKVCAEHVFSMSAADSRAVYITLNPTPLPQGSPANEPIQHGGKVKDGDIMRRVLLLVDVDPTRPPNTNATEEEKKSAYTVIQAVKEALASHGFAAPLMADSGNGYHLLYAVDLPNDEASRELVTNLLKTLDRLFSTKEAKVDTSVSNASRISKIYGTVSRKGEHTPERPHRTAKIIELPEGGLEVTERAVLARFVDDHRPAAPADPLPRPLIPSLGAYEPPLPECEISDLLSRIPQRPDHDPWTRIIAAVYHSTGKDKQLSR